MPLLDDWKLSERGDAVRYWPDYDLAAVVSGKANLDGDYGWRVFAPETGQKWLREGYAVTHAKARAAADEALRVRFGVPR